MVCCPSLIFLYSYISFSFSSLATFLSSVVTFLTFHCTVAFDAFPGIYSLWVSCVYIISVLCTLLFSLTLCLCFGHLWNQVTWMTKVFYTRHLITGTHYFPVIYLSLWLFGGKIDHQGNSLLWKWTIPFIWISLLFSVWNIPVTATSQD